MLFSHPCPVVRVTQVVGSQTELDHAVYTMDCAVLDKASHELMIVGDIGGCVATMELRVQDDPGANFIVSAWTPPLFWASCSCVLVLLWRY